MNFFPTHRLYVLAAALLIVFATASCQALPSSPATMSSPAPGSTLTASTVTFNWSSGTNLNDYHLSIGSTLNGADILDADEGLNTSATVALPTDGRTVYVKLSSRAGGNRWYVNQYTYTAYTTVPSSSPPPAPSPVAAAMSNPAPGSTLPGATVTFQWTTGSGVSQYSLSVGTAHGANNLYSATGTTTSATVSGLPADGSTIYVRLGSLISSTWSLMDYTYTAYSAPATSVPAAMTSPTPGSTLPGSSVTFQWSTGSGVSQYSLSVGTTAGGGDIFSANEGSNTSATVINLPTNGSTVYARLSSLINNAWTYADYQYIAASGSTTGTTYTVRLTDSPTTIYSAVENAKCGDVVSIQGGTYSVPTGNIARIHITGKACTAANPLVIRAADPSNQPLFDYTGHPLDGGTVPGSYTAGDYMRGAWQITNSSYVTFDGIKIKGATAYASNSVAGLRYVGGIDHLTVRNMTFQQNWNGLFGYGTNVVVEYTRFIGNGQPTEDQEHQFYDTGGDYLTLRYSTFLGNGTGAGDGCCINTDGSVSNTAGGQNLHSRSWHSAVYGNWFQDGRLYEWDMMTPTGQPSLNGITTDMYMQFYGNVVVTNATPGNQTKVMTFLGDNGGWPSGKMHLDAQWNTFYLRYPYSIYPLNVAPNNPGGQYSLFQINNDPATLGGITINYANNVLHFVTELDMGRQSLFLINTTGNGAWTITGDNNWFDSTTINTCSTQINASGGTCLLTNTATGSQLAPPFLNLSGLDLRPNAAGAFGLADTAQTLKSPQEQYAPFTLAPLSSYGNRGALQY